MVEENRKIIGYKCPAMISDWNKGDIFIPWKKSGNYHVKGKNNVISKELVETWEPVYEETLKKGDYIVFLKAYDSKPVGYISKIIDFTNSGYTNERAWIQYDGGGFRWEGNGYFLNKDFRLATAEEITSYLTLTIAGYQAKFLKNSVEFGCAKLTKSMIQELENIRQVAVNSGFRLTIAVDGTIQINDSKLDSNVLTKILSKI